MIAATAKAHRNREVLGAATRKIKRASIHRHPKLGPALDAIERYGTASDQVIREFSNLAEVYWMDAFNSDGWSWRRNQYVTALIQDTIRKWRVVNCA